MVECMYKSLKAMATVAVFIVHAVFTIAFCYSQDISKNSNDKVLPNNNVLISQIASSDSIPKGTPKIYIPETSYDFGSIMQGSKVIHTFKVYNNGDAPLKLIKAKGS